MTYKFRFVLGDWVKFRHNRTREYLINSSHNVHDVREAYFVAQEKFTDWFHPKNILKEYPVQTLIPTVQDRLETLREKGFNLQFSQEIKRDWLVKYVLWFVMQGNKDLTLSINTDRDAIPFFHFPGWDEKGRHIESLGVDLFTE